MLIARKERVATAEIAQLQPRKDAQAIFKVTELYVIQTRVLQQVLVVLRIIRVWKKLQINAIWMEEFTEATERLVIRICVHVMDAVSIIRTMESHIER